MFQEVLAFWFSEIDPKSWWIADPTFDQLVRQRFGEVLSQAAKAELYAWRSEPRGRLAEVIVLDQFSRNVYRNTPLAFAQDPMALALAQEAVASGAASALNPVEKGFLYMPFMHSESKIIHEWADRLFHENGVEGKYKSALQHKKIVDRFGRYPHRNEVLGRASTAEEIEFLQTPGSRF